MIASGVDAVTASECVDDQWKAWSQVIGQLLQREGWIADRYDGYFQGPMRLEELELREGVPFAMP